MKPTDDATPIRTRRASLPTWAWLVALSALLVATFGAIVGLVWMISTNGKSSASSTSNENASNATGTVSSTKIQGTIPSNPTANVPPKQALPEGFKANDMQATYLWLHQEYSTVEKSKSNDSAWVSTQQKLRAKLDAIVGQEVTWRFDVQSVRNGEKGKMVVNAFVYSPRMLAGFDIPVLPNSDGFALCLTNVDNFKGEKNALRRSGFYTGIAVPAEGAVLETVTGDTVELKAKIEKAIESSDSGFPPSYALCFVVSEPKLTFRKRK